VHFVGGAWGALATGLFASLAINDAGADGLFFGGGLALLGRQFVGVAATAAFSLIASLVILLLVRVFIPLRVTDEDETVGLDLSQHGEMGYNLEAV